VSVSDRVRALAVDRVNLVLCAVLIGAAAFYLWTAGSTYALSLTGAHTDPYNELANAFIHFHLSVGAAPAALLNLSEPYNPAQNGPLQGLLGGIHDFALYQGHLFLTWGPAPVIVLLVPLHLLGLEPTASVTVPLFATIGLGFALATLRVVLREIGDVPLWMCALAALTLALASAVPFILRRPAVYEEAIAGGYCFAMAGIWLAISALSHRRASLKRLASMSLCIGLTIASRPNLALIGVVMVPVYLSLRAIRGRRDLLLALIIPAGVCILLLLAYNQARFGNPLENGAKYQLAGINQTTAPFDDVSYVPPGLWFYGISPPRATAVFPFLILAPPPVSYPGSLSGLYQKQLEPTGGLLPMAPVAVFVVALPWMWRRRSTSLGRLALPLLLLAGAGIACVIFLSYVFFSTTERYEVDFSTLFLLGALAAWLALAKDAHGWRRRLVRIGGGVLIAWSCIAGVAISFTGYYNLLATTHPGTWTTLQDIGAPLSRAITMIEGHPALAEVSAPNLPLLLAGQSAHLVIVSPDSRTVVLLADLTPVVATEAGLEPAAYTPSLQVSDPDHTNSIYQIGASGEPVRISVRLSAGLNHVSLTPVFSETDGAAVIPVSQQALHVGSVSLAGSH
jgi:hypothetical protein